MFSKSEKCLIIVIAIVSFIIGILSGYLLDTQVLQKFPQKESTSTLPIAGICGCILLQDKNILPADNLLKHMPTSPFPVMCYLQ